MDKRILFISEKKSMIANSLIRAMEGHAFEVVQVRANITDISRMEEVPGYGSCICRARRGVSRNCCPISGTRSKNAGTGCLSSGHRKNWKRMHRFMEEQGYVLDITDQRIHHEIYLSDARKVAPEKLKTVVRHPIKIKGGDQM